MIALCKNRPEITNGINDFYIQRLDEEFNRNQRPKRAKITNAWARVTRRKGFARLRQADGRERSMPEVIREMLQEVFLQIKTA